MSCDAQDRSLVVRFFDSFLQEQNIKWMLGVGMLILFGSSIKLVSTGWDEISAAWKHIILLAYTGVIAVAAQQCYWRMALRKTGIVLMALTVLLVPVTFLVWSHVWRDATGDVWGPAAALFLLAINAIAVWRMVHRIFNHFLRGQQPTFVACYLALAAAGAVVPQLPTAWWPATAFGLWSLMTVGTVKVHRHVFWLTEEHRLPRIFGFFPIAVLGAEFLLLFVSYLFPDIPREWLGLACAMVAVPVLSTADAAASVFQQRTGNLVRPIPWSIVLPVVVGICLCVAGMCLAATGLPFPKALVPTAAIAAVLMGATARRTNKEAFVWAALVCVTLSYNFSYTLFRDLATQLIHEGELAVHEQRLPLAFYGLTYLPLLAGLSFAAAWAKRKGNDLFAQPARQFVSALSCLLLAAAFQHPKAVFPVGTAILAMFALQIGLFRNRKLVIGAVAAFVTASFGLTTFATDVWGLTVLPDMRLVCLAIAATALLYPGRQIDRWIDSVPAREATDELSFMHLFCQRVSLGIVLLLASVWCGRAILWGQPQDLVWSQGLLMLLLGWHALVWNSPRLGEAALFFAGVGAVIQAVHLQIPATVIVSYGTAVLLGLWLLSYVLQRMPTYRFAAVFGPASQNVSAVCLTMLLPAYYLTDLARGTITGEHAAGWGCLVLVVVWAFDAARRFASPLFTVMGCIGVVGLATTGLTDILGVAASREWLLAAYGAVALAGVVPAVLLGRRLDRYKLARLDAPVNESDRAALRAVARPLEIIVLASLLTVAVVSTLLFAFPMRVAGGMAVVGLAGLGYGRRQPELRVAFLLALNWQIFSALAGAYAPGVAGVFPITGTWLIPASLPLALAAAASILVCRFLIGREKNEIARGHLQGHGVVLNLLTGVILLASLGHLPGELPASQVALAAMTFAILLASNLWEACRTNSVARVWWAESLAGLALVYFLVFGVIHFGTGLAPFIFLGAGFTLWGMGRLAAEQQAISVLANPFVLTGMALPMAAVVLAAGRHLAGFSSTMLGTNSLALLAAAAFYFWRGVDEHRKRLIVLSAVIVNGAFALLWRELSWSDPQLFLMPLGLSILGLVELLRAEIPRPMHDPLRYAGALVILVSPTFHIVGGSWLHLFTLMAASVVVTLMSIGMRVRALMYTGVAFLIADLVAMVVRGSIDRPNLLWIAGIGLGTAVLILGALCENRREVLLQRLRVLSTELETWR